MELNGKRRLDVRQNLFYEVILNSCCVIVTRIFFTWIIAVVLTTAYNTSFENSFPRFS